MEKVNVRGKINALDVGKTLTLPKGQYIPSSVRSAACAITGDTGKRYSVSAINDTIVVTRIK